MRTIEIKLIDRNRTPVGAITWTSEGRLSSIIKEGLDEIAEPLEVLLQRTLKEGIQMSTGRPVEYDGTTLVLDCMERVTASDAQFPTALVDLINQSLFAGQHVFALMARDQNAYEEVSK